MAVQSTTDINDATSQFNRRLTTIIVMISLLCLAILMLISYVNHYVVEKQINQRMSKLTKAIIDITQNNELVAVGISGCDEIGVMAEALEVFKQNAKELQRSNRELENFAYAASHDLRSPLTAIQQLAQWTMEDSADQLTEDSKNNLEELLARIERLSKLQSDLLEYAKLGTADKSFGVINIIDIVGVLAKDLDPYNKFNIRVEQDGDSLTGIDNANYPIYTWITPLRQVLLNLINNSIKHHDKLTGNIIITATTKRGKLFVTLRDDGPGIPVKYHDKVFGLFEKLEGRGTTSGSGLGLSMVQKLIEQCGGSISIMSNPKKARGCTFIFDVPLITDPDDIKTLSYV